MVETAPGVHGKSHASCRCMGEQGLTEQTGTAIIERWRRSAVVPVWIPASCPAGVYHKAILDPRLFGNSPEDSLCRGASANVPCAGRHSLMLMCLLTCACTAGRQECSALT